MTLTYSLIHILAINLPYEPLEFCKVSSIRGLVDVPLWYIATSYINSAVDTVRAEFWQKADEHLSDLQPS